MKRRSHAALALLAAVQTLVLCAPLLADENRPKPNVIILLADDLGYNDLGCFGSTSNIPTPHLDALAKEGCKFTDFYVAAPVCTPSRAALLTGCYPPRVGMGEIPAEPDRGRKNPQHVLWPRSALGLSPAETLLPQVLKSQGYATAAIGKWHLGDQPPFWPTHHGFDSYFGIPYSNDMKPTVLMHNEDVVVNPIDQTTMIDQYAQQATAFIKDHAKSPFFLYLAFNSPHTPVHAAKRFQGSTQRGPYGDCVANIDDAVGQVMTTLKSSGLETNTLVIFTSDNGPWLLQSEDGGSAFPLRSGKMSPYEGGFRVPCIMRWPQKIQAGRVSHEIASTIDLLPTCAALTGAPLPEKKIDGKDISALLLQQDAKSPHDAYFYYVGDRLSGVRSGKWKYKTDTTLLEDYGYNPGKKLKAVDTEIPWALFNLEWDPAEQKDVSKDHPDVVKRLRGYLDDMRKDLGDARTQTAGPGKRPIGRSPDTKAVWDKS